MIAMILTRLYTESLTLAESHACIYTLEPGFYYETEDGWLFLHLAILKQGRHMQTRNLHLAVVVGEYYDPGAFWIYGSVVRWNNVLTSIARSNREWLKRSCVQKFSNPRDHEQ